MSRRPSRASHRAADSGLHGRERGGRGGMALLVTLFLLAILSLILVALVNQTSLDHQASANYTKSIRAEEIGISGLEMVVGQLRQELSKDQLPDLTYPAKPLYTNVVTTNLAPQPVGTNAAMPLLVKISTNAPPFIGTRAKGTLIASTVGTGTASLNGRVVGTNRWDAPYLGSFPSAAALPKWIIMTRSGPSDGSKAIFGGTGNGSPAINNASIDNTNYAIGRFAYAVYDVGGLLDITVAGYPTNLITPAQAQALKGTLAGANVAALGIDPGKLTAWRNAGTAATAASYLTYVTNFASTNGFRSVFTNDTTFLSRQDLIKAAQAGTAGLTTASLTNLTVFTRERNSPTWKPQSPAGAASGGVADYAGQAMTVTATNCFVPLVRRSKNATITTYQLDATASPYPYKVVAGDPLVYRRFPLDRIKWIGTNGPQNGGTDDAIQSCFGLKWDSTTGLWKYVGSTLPFQTTTEQSGIKTLADVAAETTPREPNFFELLQEGILAGSLGLDGHLSAGGKENQFSYETFHEQWRSLHILRIGASILSQYEPSCAPIVIEYGPGIQAAGVDNLPYLNMLVPLVGSDPAVVPSGGQASLQAFLVLGLWNPHQGTTATRPEVRLRVAGAVSLGNYFGRNIAGNNPVTFNYAAPLNKVNGYQITLNGTAELSNAAGTGVNGFVDPHALTPGDFLTTPSTSTSTGSDWAALPKIQGAAYAGYRLPNYVIDTTDKPLATAGAQELQGWNNVLFELNSNGLNGADPFNCWLEFKNPGGVWVPYNYHAGINETTTWFSKNPGSTVEFLSSSTGTAQPQPLDAPSTASILYFRKYPLETSDPRSLRFNYASHATAASYADGFKFMNSSIWSSAADSASQQYGRAETLNPYLFGNGWAPASLVRNNTTVSQVYPFANSAIYAAYKDPDGIQRISDSGLFPDPKTTPPSTANGWQGDPYALSTTRTADRPVILNRPFYSVGELGYVNRDYPWRTLDFFTANSADSGLLDLFTVSDSLDPVLRGRVNLNTRNPTVLTAVLQNTMADVIGGTPLSNPSMVAASLVTRTAPGSGTPLLGKDRIATEFVPGLAAANFGGTDEQFVKSRREGVTRALADVGQTRTWNLLIDIVSQAGRYPETASRLDQFVVEGEHHFWLHVAIDRYTGEVVDQQLERVLP